MANPILNLGNNEWATKSESLLGYSKSGSNFKSVPFTHSRASVGTTTDRNGVVETISGDTPRIDFQDNEKGALLLEPQRTNLSTYSEDFSNSAWTKGNLTVSSNTAVAPNGTLTADSITPNATTTAIRLYQAHTTSATDYSLSFFVKSNGRQYVQLLFGGVLSAVYSNFDLVNGTVTAGTSGAGKIEYYNNGWYRISLKASLNAGTDQIYLWSIDSVSAARGSTSTGNGTDGYYVWGSQFEQGTYESSYIPTEASSVTRLVDSSHLLNHSLFTDYPFTVYAKAEVKAIPNDFFSLVDNTSSEKYLLFQLSGATQISVHRRNSITNDSDYYYFSYSIGDTLKVAISYISATAYKLYINGTQIGNVTSGSSLPFAYPDIILGQQRVTSDTGRRNPISEFMVFNEALSDSELQTLTTL